MRGHQESREWSQSRTRHHSSAYSLSFIELDQQVLISRAISGQVAAVVHKQPDHIFGRFNLKSHFQLPEPLPAFLDVLESSHLAAACRHQVEQLRCEVLETKTSHQVHGKIEAAIHQKVGAAAANRKTYPLFFLSVFNHDVGFGLTEID